MSIKSKNLNKTVKFLIFLLIFLIIIFIFVFVFIIPSIKEYKDLRYQYRSNIKLEKKLKKDKSELKNRLIQKRKKNQKIINIFEKKFDKKNFINFAKNYFNEIKIKELKSKSNQSALRLYSFDATIKSKDPRKFYDFIKNLKNYGNLIKINFPIKIETQNSKLHISFHMNIYSMSKK